MKTFGNIMWSLLAAYIVYCIASSPTRYARPVTLNPVWHWTITIVFGLLIFHLLNSKNK